jgi:hypothetical protein
MTLTWSGDRACGHLDRVYSLQRERVRGEPPYYSVYVYEGDGVTPSRELVSEELGCTRRQAQRMAHLYDRGVVLGYRIKDLPRRY